MGIRIKRMYDDHVGTLRAMNPATGKVEWEYKDHLPLWGGDMAELTKPVAQDGAF